MQPSKPVGLVTQLARGFALRARRHRFQKELGPIITRIRDENPDRPIRILDAGGSLTFWKEVGFPATEQVRIVLINVNTYELAVKPGEEPPFFTAIVGDATDLSQFGDQSFDLVVSNSVIAHVGPEKNQARMADEVRRAGKHFFVQTPNKWFLIDWRTWVPFPLTALPHKVQAVFLKYVPTPRYRRPMGKHAAAWVAQVHSLGKSELRRRFPGAKLYRERIFLVFSKSFTVTDLSLNGRVGS
jgi:SAM-dependent methyltransferase